MLAATKFTLNVTMISAIDLLTRLTSYILLVFLARNLSVSDFGLYNFTFFFFFLFTLISDFGMQIYVIREIAQGDRDIFRRSFATRFYMALFAYLLYALTVNLLSIPVDFKLLMLIYGTAIFPIAVTNAILAVFRGLENFFHERVVLISKNLCFILLAVPALIITRRLAPIMVAYVLSEVFSVFQAIYLAKRNSLMINLNFLKFSNVNFSLLKKTLPLIMGVGLLVVYYKIDSIMLKLLKDDFQTGIYSSAYRIYEALLFIPVAVQTIILPRFVKANKKDPYEALAKVLKVLLIAATFISLFLIINSNLVSFIYGSKYKELELPLKIIFLVMPLAFVNYIVFAMAYVERNDNKAIIPILITVIVNILANYAFIPKYGYIATAWSTNLSEILLLVMISVLVLKNKSILLLVLKYYLAFLISLSFYMVGSPVVSTLLAFSCYLGLLILTKAFNREDRDVFRNVIVEILDSRNIKHSVVKQ